MINRNVIVTFISSVGASAISLLTVPIYLHLIGPARYGVVAFVWLIVGYFGLFILGLDKAITNILARHRHDPDQARSLFQTAMILNLLTSGAGALILYAVGYQILARTLGVNDDLRDEILAAMPWIAASVPLATTTALLIGTFEAYERFRALASTQFSATMLFQIVPILVAWLIGPQLTWVIPAAILARTGSTLWMLALLWPTLQLGAPIRLRRQWVAQLLRYGSSISISGIVSPILVSLDRLLIGASLGAAAVSYYVVPSSLINVVQIVPGSVLRVMFPQLSILPPAAAQTTAIEAVQGLNAILTPLITIGLLAIRPFMTLWLGAEFAALSQDVAAILLFGAWINCLAWVPVSLLQAQQRPGLVARLHVGELIPFIALVWLGVRYGGVEGAAIACALRMWTDALLLFHVSGLARPALHRVAAGALQVTAALVLTLAVPWTSPYYIAAATALTLASVTWSATQLPIQQRNRILALLRPR